MAQIDLMGDIGLGGTYILHITVETACLVAFGRFRGGVPIAMPAGDYLYIGSALAGRGAASLPQRLLRHATRAGDRPAHDIRGLLLATLQAAGATGAMPPPAKTLRWHIDYLLDLDTVFIVAIYARGDGVAREQALAAELAADTQVWLPAPGLGASDDPRGTHLLGVPGDATWWQRLTTWLHAGECQAE